MQYYMLPNGQLQEVRNDFTDALYKAAQTIQQSRIARAQEAEGMARAKYSENAAEDLRVKRGKLQESENSHIEALRTEAALKTLIDKGMQEEEARSLVGRLQSIYGKLTGGR